MLAANAQNAGDNFEDRFPKPAFNDRFPSAGESLIQRQVALAPPPRTVRSEPVRVASLTPTLNLPRQTEREELTTLVSMKSSAFPYFGNNPRSEAPFLNISKGDRKGHRSYGGRVYWQDETYSDNRVLLHVPETFDARKDLPVSWAGLQGDGLAAATGVPDAVFCHNNLFIAACKSYDGIREMARQALAA